ncbi:PH domain leucine-rich repeat-containing protein phosphatase 2 [Latimeria chalumnae]|uniref:PH domain leucine-rich repeat-containing protein phosphatase 2 n=1 Tax=Latimeria chalumnae TaxID=7897 RepID=UPI00313F03FF
MEGSEAGRAAAAAAERGSPGAGESGERADAVPGKEPPEPAGYPAAAAAAARGSRGGTGIRLLQKNMRRSGSKNCMNRKSRFGSREREWLKEDVRRGCLYIYGADGSPSSSDMRLVLCTTDTTAAELCTQGDGESLYLQLHGDLLRRLDPMEKPLQIVYNYLSGLGFEDLRRMQEEAANADLGCMIRFYNGKPCSGDQLDRILLSGVFSVRKGKTQLHKWSERLVILCGTCLIVSSVKECQAGKMHVLQLVGGKVEEVKRRQHCLAFSSAGPQLQTYFVSFDSPTECQRWLRQAAKVVSQRLSSVDLSCYSLEEVPEPLFYSQDITQLNLRQNFLRLDGEGGLANLSRFSQLKNLNLSQNRLGVFLESVCEIVTLTELNLSCNGIQTLPPAIGNLLSLQNLALDGNLLCSLPDELTNLKQLSSLGLSFNNFATIPEVCERLTTIDRLAMTGNQLETLPLDALGRATHLKCIDLRLNSLSTVTLESLEVNKHITQLDLRDNQLMELDLSSLGSLTQLHCERNRLRELSLSGFSLRALHAGSNRLTAVNIYPVPTQLTSLDLSRNYLECVPDWVCEARKIEVLDFSWNHLIELPARLLSSLSLRKLMVGHNHLQSIPALLEHIPLEVFNLQHNFLTELPENLFFKALNLRYLNVSANNLESLPPAGSTEESLSMLQELYLTNNNLADECILILMGHPNLRILHIAYNQLQTFPASKLSKLEQLEELNMSGNKLRTVPTTISNCKRLHSLSAHSNNISVFPEILNLPEIKFVDLSCNELTEIVIQETLPPTLQELDLTGNTNLVLEHRTLDIFSHIPTLKMDQKASMMSSDLTGSPLLWNHGFAEMAGQKNKLCVSVLAVDNFTDGVEALYGMFDGDKNEEVPRLLQCTMGDVLSEEVQQSSVDAVYMTNTFLVSHRKLGMSGQKLGSSALLCYIRHDPSDSGSYFSVTQANVGTCQAVLCRDGQPLPLSRVFSLENCNEETQRVKLQKAIITEDNKVNGVTCCSRQLGCTYLHPWVLPTPHVHTVPLTPQDDLLVLGNRALWEYLSYKEAIAAVQNMPDPKAAAKKLCTLAQSYGCRDNVGAVVVYLSLGDDSCTCEMPGAPLGSSGVDAPPVGVVKDALEPATPSLSSGIASEFSSEMSASEVSSEVGSTASDEQTSAGLDGGLLGRPERRCSLHPLPNTSLFQRQPSCATFSSNQSDNGLDSDDDQPVEGVMSNGSKVEVEVDIHCFKGKDPKPASPLSGQDITLPCHNSEDDSPGLCFKIQRQNSINSGALLAVGRERTDLKKSPSTSSLYGKKLSNGSVVPLEESLNLIEVANEAPKKKTGYFAAPAQLDPEDQFIVPPDLEEEVREQIKQHQEQISESAANRESRTVLTEVYDTAL